MLLHGLPVEKPVYRISYTVLPKKHFRHVCAGADYQAPHALYGREWAICCEILCSSTMIEALMEKLIKEAPHCRGNDLNGVMANRLESPQTSTTVAPLPRGESADLL